MRRRELLRDYRVVISPVSGSFVIAASLIGWVRLGPAIVRLANAVQNDILSVVRPTLAQFSDELGETVDLSAVKGDCLVFMDQVIGPQRLRAVTATHAPASAPQRSARGSCAVRLRLDFLPLLGCLAQRTS